jgi:hypothetical protein
LFTKCKTGRRKGAGSLLFLFLFISLFLLFVFLSKLRELKREERDILFYCCWPCGFNRERKSFERLERFFPFYFLSIDRVKRGGEDPCLFCFLESFPVEKDR